MAIENTCPHCRQEHCLPDVVFGNVEAYGSRRFTVECIHCGKMLEATVVRLVKVQDVRKSNKKHGDF